MEDKEDPVKKLDVPLDEGAFQSFPEQRFDLFSTDILYCSSQENRHSWSVSWSDLMMTMFILFAVMYVYKAENKELKVVPVPFNNTEFDSGFGKIVRNNHNTRPSDIFKQTKKAVQDEIVDNSIRVDLMEDSPRVDIVDAITRVDLVENSTRVDIVDDSTRVDLVDDRAVRITLSGDLFFDVGSADLKFNSKLQLKKIGKILKENSFVINVIGHTDSTPTHSMLYPTNWELSTARACRVARYLITEAGVPKDRFFVSGHASLLPLMPNSTAANRSLNRRVEIILMKDRPYAEPVSSVGFKFNSRTVNNG